MVSVPQFAPKSVTFLVNGAELAADLFELVLESGDAGFELGTGVVSVVDLSGEMKDVAFELLVPVFGVFAHLSELAPESITFLVNGGARHGPFRVRAREQGCALELGTGVVSMPELAPKSVAFLVNALKLAADLFELVLETGDAGFEFGTGVVSVPEFAPEPIAFLVDAPKLAADLFELVLESGNAAFQFLSDMVGVLAHLSEFAPKPIAFLVDARKLATDLFELVLETGDAGFEFGTGVVSVPQFAPEPIRSW